ncbi:MAG: hypothetical protein QOI70_1808, partial [Microbacteriaceae bacterium]|nr:hypothetical protein [Microbacteriaceae bacterium]
AHTWSVIARTYAEFNRHGLVPEPDWVSVDHRQGALFASSDVNASIRASRELTPDLGIYIESVHRLSDLGAVVTNTSVGTAHEGFAAEWRMIQLLTVDGDRIGRLEMFDEADLDAALVRFDELDRQPQLLENTATRTWARLADAFNRRDLDGFLALTTADGGIDDRRKGLRALFDGPMRREGVRALFDAPPSSWRMEVEPIAIRGSRLSLTRERYRDTDDADRPVVAELLTVMEVTDGDLVHETVDFDVDDTEAAFEELDARYIAGEAAAHGRTWSLISEGFAALNRREVPATTLDFVNVDHRPVTAVEPGDLVANLRAVWDQVPDISLYLEAVHRLSDLGAVVTQAVHGTSQEGFEAEWREIHLVTIEGELFNRSEMFDEADLDAALARFDELNAPTLENAATRARARQAEAFNLRNLDGFLAGYSTAEARYEDRRKGLRDDAAGPGLTKRARALFEAPKRWRTEMEPVAIRGPRLALTRDRYRDTDSDRTITAEHLTLTEVGDDDLVYRTELFDPDDINGAIGELTARWIASGDVAHPHVIEAVCRLIETVNSHEWDAFATLSAGATYVNHRQLSSPGVETIADHMPSIRTMASLVPDYWVELAEVLTHSPIGVVGDVVLRGTSTDGLAIEIPLVMLVVVDRDRVTGFEAFDPDQRDMALARFEALNQPT